MKQLILGAFILSTFCSGAGQLRVTFKPILPPASGQQLLTPETPPKIDCYYVGNDWDAGSCTADYSSEIPFVLNVDAIEYPGRYFLNWDNSSTFCGTDTPACASGSSTRCSYDWDDPNIDVCLVAHFLREIPVYIDKHGKGSGVVTLVSTPVPRKTGFTCPANETSCMKKYPEFADTSFDLEFSKTMVSGDFSSWGGSCQVLANGNCKISMAPLGITNARAVDVHFDCPNGFDVNPATGACTVVGVCDNPAHRHRCGLGICCDPSDPLCWPEGNCHCDDTCD